jgi:hypothetical protein
MRSRFLQLFEMPIDQMAFHGDWGPNAKPRGYDHASIGILQSPAGLEKIRTKWAKVNQDFDIFFVRSPKGFKHTEVGEVPWDWCEKNLGVDIRGSDDKVTLVFTNNKAADRIPMTAWTLAHRFGHAARSSRGPTRNTMAIRAEERISKILDNTLEHIAMAVYGTQTDSRYSYLNGRDAARPNRDLIFRRIAEGLGTMKSARDGRLLRYREFVYEMLAQYMITGSVKLNTRLPEVLATRFAWGKKQGPWRRNIDQHAMADVVDRIENLQNEADAYAYETLESALARIYVM